MPRNWARVDELDTLGGRNQARRDRRQEPSAIIASEESSVSSDQPSQGLRWPASTSPRSTTPTPTRPLTHQPSTLFSLRCRPRWPRSTPQIQPVRPETPPRRRLAASASLAPVRMCRPLVWPQPRRPSRRRPASRRLQRAVTRVAKPRAQQRLPTGIHMVPGKQNRPGHPALTVQPQPTAAPLRHTAAVPVRRPPVLLVTPRPAVLTPRAPMTPHPRTMQPDRRPPPPRVTRADTRLAIPVESNIVAGVGVDLSR